MTGSSSCPSTTARALTPGESLVGPLIIQQLDTTTLVLSGQGCDVHPSGSLLIREREAGESLL